MSEATMDLIQATKVKTVSAMEMFLRNFSHVPEDRLDWAPTPTAKSALRIGAHTALYAERFAKMISEQSLPHPNNLHEWLAEREREEIAVRSRDEVASIFRAGTAKVLEALDSIVPAVLETSLDSGQGWSMSMIQVIGLPEFHALAHMGQIDYLQTCWNDQEIYVG